MAYSAPTEVNFTDNGYQQTLNAQAAAQAAAKAQSANKAVDDIQNKNVYTPAEKRLLKTRVDIYKAQYATILANSNFSKLQYVNVFTSNYNDFMNRANKIIANLDTTTVLSDGDAYYLSSDESFLQTYFASINKQLQEIENKHWDSVSVDIANANSLADAAAETAKTNAASTQSAVNQALNDTAVAFSQINSLTTEANQAIELTDRIPAISTALDAGNQNLSNMSISVSQAVAEAQNAASGVTSLSDAFTSKISSAATMTYVNQTADELKTVVADQSQSMTAYTDAKAGSLAAMISDANGQATAITATVSGLSTAIVNTSQSLYNYAKQRADGIEQTIANVKNDVYTYVNAGAGSAVEVYASGISAAMSAISSLSGSTVAGMASLALSIDKTAGSLDIKLNQQNSEVTELKATTSGLEVKVQNNSLSLATFSKQTDDKIEQGVANFSQSVSTYFAQTASGFAKMITDAKSDAIAYTVATAGSTQEVYASGISAAMSAMGSLSGKIDTNLTSIATTISKRADKVDTAIRAANAAITDVTQTASNFGITISSLSNGVNNLDSTVSSAVTDFNVQLKNISAEVSDNGYKNMFEIDSDGIKLVAKKDNPEIANKKIIISGDEVEIAASAVVDIAGALKSKTITAPVIQSADNAMILNADTKYFKLGDFNVTSDGTVSIQKGDFNIQKDNYSFQVGDLGGGDAGIKQMIGSVSNPKLVTWLDNNGFHQAPNGDVSLGTFIQNGGIKVVVTDTKMDDDGQYDPDGIAQVGRYYSPTINIGNSGAGTFVRLVSNKSKSDGSGGYVNQTASDHVKLGYYPNFGDGPQTRCYISNRRIEFYDSRESSSTNKATLTTGMLFLGNMQINNNHTIMSNDGGTIYFRQKEGGKAVKVNAASFDKASKLSLKHVENVIDGDQALAAICGTDYAAFTYKDDDLQETQYGPIIDDMNETKKYQVDSRLVSDDGNSISQDNLVNLTAAAVKELAARVAELSAKLAN